MISLVNQNGPRVEPFATIVDNAFERYTSELETKIGHLDNKIIMKPKKSNVKNLSKLMQIITKKLIVK